MCTSHAAVVDVVVVGGGSAEREVYANFELGIVVGN